MKYNRKLGSKKEQGIVTPSGTSLKKTFYSKYNYRKLQNIWKNNVRGRYQWSTLSIPVLRQLRDNAILVLPFYKKRYELS